jgi:hypothetical protein
VSGPPESPPPIPGLVPAVSAGIVSTGFVTVSKVYVSLVSFKYYALHSPHVEPTYTMEVEGGTRRLSASTTPGEGDTSSSRVGIRHLQ